MNAGNLNQLEAGIAGAQTRGELEAIRRLLAAEEAELGEQIRRAEAHFRAHGAVVRTGPRRGLPLTKRGRSAFLYRLASARHRLALVLWVLSRLYHRADALPADAAQVLH